MGVFVVLKGADKITVVNNYSDLPAPSSATEKFYWVNNEQGTSWRPGWLGGTYYNSGLYYSNGTDWKFMNVPYQALQSDIGIEVGDGGTENTKFITSEGLRGKGYSRVNKICGEDIPAHRVVVLNSDQIYLFDPNNPAYYNKVLGISYQSGNTGQAVDVITDDEIDFGISLTDGSIYYGGPTGTLVTTPPSTGIVQPLGWAHSTSRFMVHIGTPILKS